MTFNMYSANFKTWDHVGNVTPNTEYSEATRPHGEYMVADWLPVSRYDKYHEEYFVVSAGKAVAFDLNGRVVPAGLKVAFAVASGDVLTYVATTDNAEGVIDLTTGLTVSAAGAGYTRAEISAALIERGLIDESKNAEDFISFPVGVAPYNYYKWAGGDGSNPADLIKTNHILQHRVAILCKYVIELPVVPVVVSAITPASGTAISGTQITDWTVTSSANGAWFNATALSATIRYEDVDVGDNVVALNLAQMHLAKDTTLTPFTNATGMTREVDSITNLTTAGDYYVDYEVGVILFYEADGNAIPAGLSGTFTYYHYDSVPASVSTYACAVGDLVPGDFVRPDANSNFTKALVFTATNVADYTSDATNPSDAEWAVVLNAAVNAQREIIGQVLDFEYYPKDYLDRVRTAYPALSTVDQMPGSASGGLPAAVTYAGAANRMIRVLLLK